MSANELSLTFKLKADSSNAVAVVERASKSMGASVERLRASATRSFSQMRESVNSFGDTMQSVGVRMTVGLTASLAALAAVSTRSALQLDTLRNRLLAVEGSAASAERRITTLRELALASVGVTSKTALDAYSQFKTIGDITESTIERQIKAFGRLNAAFTIDDPQLFNRNIQQIFDQSFEVKDIKEALGRIPIFNQLLQSAFGSSDPEKLRQLKASGKLTLDTYLAGLAGAVENHPTLSRIRESLSVRLEKTFERIQFALAPLGESILKAIEPFIEPTARLIERISDIFASLPESVKNGVLAFGAVLAAAGPLVVALGAVVAAVSAVGAPFAAVAVAVSVAAAALAAAWVSNFGGIQEITTRVLGEVSSFIREVMGTLLRWWEQNLPLLRQTLETVLNGIRQFWETHGRQITAIVTATWQNIKTVVSVALNGVLSFIKIVLQIINNDWRGAWETYQAALGVALRGIGVLLSRLPGIVEGVMNTLLVVVVTAAIEIRQRAEEAGEQIGRALVLSILRGIASLSPQTAIAAELGIAISGAGEQATRVAQQQGSQAGQAYLSGFNSWLQNLGRPATQWGAAEGPWGEGGVKEKPKAGQPAGDEKETAKAAKALARARAAEIDAANVAAEAAFKKAVDAAEVAFTETGNFANLIGALKRAEADRWEARKVQFDAERAEIRKRDQSAALIAAELNVENQKQAAAQYTHLERLAELDRDLGSKRLAALQQQHKRELELEEQQSRAFIAEQKRRAELGLISFAEAERRVVAETVKLMGSRQAKLEEEAEAARGNAEAYEDITHQLKLLKGETDRFVSDASASVSTAIGKDIDRIIGLAEKAMERLRALAPATPGVDPNFKIPHRPGQEKGPYVDPAEFQAEQGAPPPMPTPDFSTHKMVIEEFKNFAVGAFQGIAGGFGQMIQAFLVGGNTAGQSVGKMVKAVVGGLAAQALVEAAMQVAHGLAALANPFTAWRAPLHFAAAKAFALVGGVAAGIALAIPGGGGGGAGSLADTPAREDARARREREQREGDRGVIREERRGGTPDPLTPVQFPPPPPMHIFIHEDVKSDGSVIRDRVFEVLDGDRRARDTIIHHVGQELEVYNGKLNKPLDRALGEQFRKPGEWREALAEDGRFGNY